MEDKEILDIYPEMLKRLDDSLDSIRIAVTNPFCIYFEVLIKKGNIRLGNFPYIIESLFTHLDDPSEAVRKSIFFTLQTALKFNPSEFIAKAKIIKTKHKHPRSVGELIEMAKTL